ncbi:MnhB domain-containing protein [Trujillonella humicola]|uniref:MnhB domain-containing protein n=1 Tax=Trujillonella humicola TaxID=3383699 RepID=UPI0039069F58
MSDAVGLVLDVVLASAAVVLSALCLLVRSRSTAVVLFIGLGVVVAAGYARLAAPDLALAEVGVGAAATGALLLRTVATTSGSRSGGAADVRTGSSGRGRRTLRGAAVATAVLATGAVLAVALVPVLTEPAPGRLPELVAGRVPDSGVEHPVTAVLLAFRAFDTLLEVAVVLVAAVVCVALVPPHCADWAPAPPSAAAPLSFLARAAVPLGVVLAGWVLYVGSYGPGGAFQGGAVLAGLLVLLVLAGRRPGVLRPEVVRYGLVLGTAVFLAVGIAGVLGGRALLTYGELGTAAIVTIETALALSVGVTLAVFYLCLVPPLPRDLDASRVPLEAAR